MSIQTTRAPLQLGRRDGFVGATSGGLINPRGLAHVRACIKELEDEPD